VVYTVALSRWVDAFSERVLSRFSFPYVKKTLIIIKMHGLYVKITREVNVGNKWFIQLRCPGG